MNEKLKCLLGPKIEDQCTNVGLLISRVAIGLMMALSHGLGKIPPSERLIEGVTAMGFPMPVVFAWCAGLSEFVGGIFVAIGFMTRLSAASVTFTMLIAATVVHAADPFAKKEFALVYLFAFLLFSMAGAGKYSVDSFLMRKCEK